MLNMIQKIYEIVDYFSDMESQDTVQTLEMSQAMLNDVIEYGAIHPVGLYIRRYATIVDTAEEMDELIANFT